MRVKAALARAEVCQRPAGKGRARRIEAAKLDMARTDRAPGFDQRAPQYADRGARGGVRGLLRQARQRCGIEIGPGLRWLGIGPVQRRFEQDMIAPDQQRSMPSKCFQAFRKY